jgi:hypothetical protein
MSRYIACAAPAHEMIVLLLLLLLLLLQYSHCDYLMESHFIALSRVLLLFFCRPPKADFVTGRNSVKSARK